MEQEKHLIEQTRSKFCTRSTARHLRRKRLKDARRAEKQLLDFINSANDNNIDKEINSTSENNKTEEIQPKLLSIKLKDSSKFPQSSSKAEYKEQDQCDYCNESTELKQTRVQTIDLEKHSSHLSCSPGFLNGSKHEINTLQVSQTKNNEKEKHAISSVINSVEFKQNLLDASLYSIPNFSNTNCNLSYSTLATLDLNFVEDLMENERNFKLNDLSNVIDSNSSTQNNIKITDNKVQTDAENHFVNFALSSKAKNIIMEKESNSNNKKSDVSAQKLVSSIKMVEEKPNLSEKMRENIKVEREAKKAAKAAAKAAKMQSDKLVGIMVNIKNEFAAVNCEIPVTSLKMDVTANQQFMKEAKKNIIQSSNIATQNNVYSEDKNEGKSKSELRAERRAKQEAQRAAKQQLLSIEQQQSLTKDNTLKNQQISSVKSHVENGTSEYLNMKKSIKKEDGHEINLFKHLYHERQLSSFNIAYINSSIHPAIIRLGVQYASKTIVGSNARCVALLTAIKRVVEDFEKPTQADFIRGFEASLQEPLAYLHHCRPFAVSMQNAIRHLKWQMTQFSSALSDGEAKNKLKCVIDTYIMEQIQLADKAISITIQSKISNGNVILTYGYSSLIHKILVEAHAVGKQFRVIVVDGRPWLEGKEQLRRLAKYRIECSYILINALSFVMPEVSKVFLGAHAILANGAVMSRVGTAQVALIAKAFNVPVLVACETHKSCERVQTDSIVYNELGNADELTVNTQQSNNSKFLLTNWRRKKSLNLLNITYDVTPADLVTAVVTELAILPCTSVPVILRIKPSEI